MPIEPLMEGLPEPSTILAFFMRTEYSSNTVTNR